MLLKDQVAVITGAARAIGRSIAERFAEEGAQVVIGDVMVQAGETAAHELSDRGYAAIFSELNVIEEESIRQTLARCLEAFGRVDILVNNAGVNLSKPVVELSREEWDRVLSINLTGSFLCSRIFCQYMIEQKRGGNILFMSSQAGKRGEAGASAYCASKFGVIGLMQCLALEMAPHGIRVNGVCPGNVETPMLQWLLEETARRQDMSAEAARQKLLRLIPLGRPATPTEIANAFVFLASPLASYICGETINVDGGELSG